MINSFVLSVALSMLPLQNSNLWKLFEKVPFESRFIQSENGSFYIPQFTDELRQMEGKLCQIRGYYLPIDVAAKGLVLSRYPMATCFFCGEAGPESVMMVFTATKLEGLKMDEEITFEGILELNSDDVYQLSFILKNARRL